MRTDVASPQAWCEGLCQTRGEGRRSFLKGTGLAEAAGESKGKKRVGYVERSLSYCLG